MSTSDDQTPRQGWRVKELAEIYGGSETSWLEAIRRGDLPARRIGARTLIVLKPDLEEFLERSRTDKKLTVLPTGVRRIRG